MSAQPCAGKQVTMQAWQFVDTGAPLQLVDLPAPSPGAGEVVIDVKTCGLCHSDVSIQYNAQAKASLPFHPITLGHEISGVVRAVGEGVSEWAPGDRVAVWSTPRHPSIPGFTRHGGYAEQHLAPATDLVRLPDGVSFAQASYAADAGMTAYSGMVRRGGIQAGWKVGVIGFGGLGQAGARIAQVLGAQVHIAEPKSAARDAAAAQGFERIVENATAWRGQDFDLIVDYAGVDTTEIALESVRTFGGRVVQVGASKSEALVLVNVLLRDKDLLGNFGGLKEDLAAVLDLMANGLLAPDYTEIPFSDVQEGLARLHRGEVIGRQVARVAN